MCEAVNMYDLLKDILAPGLIAGAIAYSVNKFQYKAQKDIAFINPRIEFAKKYEQILFFDDYQDDDYIDGPINHIQYTPSIDEKGDEHFEFKHIRKYKKNLEDVSLEANLLLSLKLGKKISQLVSVIQKLFNEYEQDNSMDLGKIFSKRERKYLDSFTRYLKKKHQKVFDEYKKIRNEINDFIYKPEKN